MLASRVLLLGLLCLGPRIEPATQSGSAPVVESLAARLAAANDSGDPVLSSKRRSAIFFEARDFAAVLREVSSGLQHDPLALELLWRASASELWLGDGGRALSWLERLGTAINALELEPSERESWLAAVADFEEQAQQLLEKEAAGLRALSRARLTIGGSALGALALFAWLVSSGRKH